MAGAWTKIGEFDKQRSGTLFAIRDVLYHIGYLKVKGEAIAIAFYAKAFNATEIMRLGSADGKIGHAEIQIGDSRIMLADEHPHVNALAPQSPGSSGVGLCLYVDDVDAVVAQALNAGAKIQRPLQDQFYGDSNRRERWTAIGPSSRRRSTLPGTRIGPHVLRSRGDSLPLASLRRPERYRLRHAAAGLEAVRQTDDGPV